MVNYSKDFRRCGLGLGLLVLAASYAEAADTTYVRIATTEGNIDVQLFSDEAPRNVANFLSYVDSGAYNNTFIHRAIPDFIIQGGGFSLTNTGSVNAVPANAAVSGEPGILNTRGTIAMALQSVDVANGGGSQNTGTTNWFFNVQDNPSLDSAQSTTDANNGLPAVSGPFTVFGTTVNASSLAVMDAISNTATYPYDSPFNTLPLLNFSIADFESDTPIPLADFVYVTSVTRLSVTNFSTWQANNFTGARAGDGGLSATPLNDGITNLMKYLCDIDPTVPVTAAEQARLPATTWTTVSGTLNLTVTYHQLSGIGVTVVVQSSTDLKTWATATDATTSMTGTDSSGYAIMQTTVPMTGTARFIRLGLTATQ